MGCCLRMGAYLAASGRWEGEQEGERDKRTHIPGEVTHLGISGEHPPSTAGEAVSQLGSYWDHRRWLQGMHTGNVG